MCVHHILFICLFLSGRLDRVHHLARVRGSALNICMPHISGSLRDRFPHGCPTVVAELRKSTIHLLKFSLKLALSLVHLVPPLSSLGLKATTSH